ncbi:MAG: hypothetical protein RLN63_01965, partial [Miltoncostaeaceae bacterium]
TAAGSAVLSVFVTPGVACLGIAGFISGGGGRRAAWPGGGGRGGTRAGSGPAERPRRAVVTP